MGGDGGMHGRNGCFFGTARRESRREVGAAKSESRGGGRHVKGPKRCEFVRATNSDNGGHARTCATSAHRSASFGRAFWHPLAGIGQYMERFRGY